MKKILIAVCSILSLSASAQQNKLLDQSFWQSVPDVSAVKTAVEQGNNPSQLNAMSMDAVVMAINTQAPAATIKYLLDQPGNNVNKLTHDARTYLHWAANRGNVEVVEYLLKKGAKVSIEDSHGTTPLLFAASGGQQNTQIYDLLIANGADLKKELGPDGANALLLGIANDKDLKLTDYFIGRGLSLNSTDASGNNAFSYAARSANIELLKTVLQKGVKPNQNAMLMAAQGGGRRGGSGAGLPVYQYLESLDIKPNVINKNGENVLHYLVRKPNQVEIIRYFLDKGVDVNQADEEGNTVLMNAAASNRDTAVLALLMPKVKNVNQANRKGLTTLAMAARGNSADVMGFLIKHGAAVNTLDKDGNNLAYYVIESYRPQSAGNPGGFGGMQGQRPSPTQGERTAGAPRQDDLDAKFDLLKQKGLAIALPQQNGNTLYHLAVAKNDIALLKRLQPLEIDVNAKNKEGLTALHKAAMIAKDDSILKYLLSIGAQKDAVTSFKETAFDLASENESLAHNKVSVTFLK